MNQKATIDGGCAYPITLDFQGPCINPLTGKSVAGNHTDRHIDLGLTKRDHFAALAMAAVISGRSAHYGGAKIEIDDIASQAYLMADAMIRAREA